MRTSNRREFLAAAAGVCSVRPLEGGAPAKPRVGLVQSTHRKLARPAPVSDPLDYERVREMVWKAIRYGNPKAGSLEAKIKPGSWVVVKPNLIALRSRRSYRTGDITDMRVTKAVLEYVARFSQAGRISFAEGGSIRRIEDPNPGEVNTQNGVRVDARNFDWGDAEFPGFSGTLTGMLEQLGQEYRRKIDYIDLNYDAVRDASGGFQRIHVPKTPRGVGAFGARPDYVVTNTVTNCDFLITVPVMKVHSMCGITACLKNYVGTAPREFYAPPGSFSNTLLHKEHSLENRIDSFIVDLAAFHPPDYCVVDGIRGLQYSEHGIGKPDQMLQNNLVMAGEDPVAMDAMVAYLLGFNTWDVEFLHMAASRDMGTMDLDRAKVSGDDPSRIRQSWAKPRRWYGRANREWLVTRSPDSDLRSWSRYATPTDTLHFAKWAGDDAAPGTTFGAAVRVRSAGRRKAFLWLGMQGRASATLNGEQVLEEENLTRYRIGQFQQPVELRSGENLLVFRITAPADAPQLSAQLVDPSNNGDTVEGIRWFV